MKHKKVVMIIIGIITVLLSVCFYSYLNPFEEAYRLIKMVECQGKTEIIRDDVGTLAAYKNMHLKNKDCVVVHEESMAILQLDDDKYVYVEPNTKFRIEAVGSESNSKTRIILEKGSIISEIQESLEDNENYEVETPNSTMSVRGTVFRVQINYSQKGESYTNVQVFDGKVASELIYPDGSISEKEVLISEGLGVKVRGDDIISEYIFTEIDGKKEIVTPINYEELPFESLVHLKTIIENQKKNLVISLDDVKNLIDKKKNKKDVITDEESSKTPLVTSKKDEQPLESDVTLRPNELREYHIHFYSDGVNIKTQQVKAGESVQLPVLDKPGYHFDGWYEDQDYQQKVLELTVSNDQTLYAKWTPRDDTKVSIHHYVKKRGNTDYELVKTEEQSGTTGETFLYQNIAFNQPITINQFDTCAYVKHKDEVVSGTITAKQPLIIKVYYDQLVQVNYHDFMNKKVITMNYPYGMVLDKKDIPTLTPSKDDCFQSVGWFDKIGNQLQEKKPLYENIDFYEKVNYQYKIEYYEMDSQNGTYSNTPTKTDSYYQKEGTNIDIHQNTDILNKYIKEGYDIDLQKSLLESTVDSNGEMVLKVYYKTKSVTVTFHIKKQGTSYTEERQLVYQYGEEFGNHSLKPEDIYQDLSQEDYIFHGWKDEMGQTITLDDQVKEDMTCYEDIEFGYKLIASVQEVKDSTKYQDQPDVYVMKYGYVGDRMIITEEDLEALSLKLDEKGTLPIEHSVKATTSGEYGTIQESENVEIVKYDRKIYTWTFVYKPLDSNKNIPNENIEFCYGEIPNINFEEKNYSSLTDIEKEDYRSVWYTTPNAIGDEDKILDNAVVTSDRTCYEIPRKRVKCYISYFFEKIEYDGNVYEVDPNLKGEIESYDTATVIGSDIAREGFYLNNETSRQESKIDKDHIGSQCIEDILDIDDVQSSTNILWMFYKKK